MFLYVLITYQVLLASGKILNFPSKGNIDLDNSISISDKPTTTLTHFEEWDDTLWVLKLNDGLNLTNLRSATESEEEYFDDEIGPMIHRCVFKIKNNFVYSLKP